MAFATKVLHAKKIIYGYVFGGFLFKNAGEQPNRFNIYLFICLLNLPLINKSFFAQTIVHYILVLSKKGRFRFNVIAHYSIVTNKKYGFYFAENSCLILWKLVVVEIRVDYITPSNASAAYVE